MAGSTAQGSLLISDPHSYERRRTYGPEPRRRVGMRGAALVRIPNPFAKSEATPPRPFDCASDSAPQSRPEALEVLLCARRLAFREPAAVHAHAFAGRRRRRHR